MPKFEKGHPRVGGRQKGTLNHSTADIKALAMKSAPEAVTVLLHLMHSSRNEATRLAAADKVLDRAIGKAAQPQTGEGGEGPAEIRHTIQWKGWNP